MSTCPRCGTQLSHFRLHHCPVPQPSMLSCPRCNTQAPNGTRFCPNCGLQFEQPTPTSGQPVHPASPPKKGNPFVIGCLGLLGLFVVIGVIGNLVGGDKGSGSSSSSPASSDTSDSSSSDSSSEPAAISISANQLSSAYNANELAADDKYKDKVLAVSGTVDSIGKDITDTPYVTLQANGDLLGIQCMFDNQYKEQLSKLHKGQQIQIHGTCKGKTLNVLLADCTLN